MAPSPPQVLQPLQLHPATEVIVRSSPSKPAPSPLPSPPGSPTTAMVGIDGLRSLFCDQRVLLDHFFDHLDIAPVQKFAKACLDCKGTIHFTGVGKSGFVAQKISQTLVSTGVRAAFLCSQASLHGDLGAVNAGDLVCLFSKSGATEELLRLVPFARAKGAALASVTCAPGSKLDAAADLVVNLPLLRELCPFALAPVTSSSLQLLFGDTIAVALVQERGLTQDRYMLNHPAGRIGRRLALSVRDVMLAGEALPVVAPGARLMDALVEMSGKRCGCVLVVDPFSLDLVGIATDGDVRRALLARPAEVASLAVDALMTAGPKTCAAAQKAAEAMAAMEGGQVSAMPVVEGGKLVGLVTLHSLVAAGL